jgi:hypothetical protein
MDSNGGVNKREGGIPLRKNFAGIGMGYDKIRDAFIDDSPFPSWILNEESCLYEPPTPYPDDGKQYSWNEENLSWIESEMP